MTAAASWTVGPSRPVDPPDSSAPMVSTAFSNAVRSETKGLAKVAEADLAAITCGMPDPRANGAKRVVI